MPVPAMRLRAFVMSPSDTRAERDALEKVAAEINRSIGSDLGLVLELIRWESHFRPGIDSDAQAVINRQLLPPDIFIAVFWTRLGTPTPRAPSGTAEEFNMAVDAWESNREVEILTYFNAKEIPPRDIDPDQLSALRQFRAEVEGRGVLVSEFRGVADFEAKSREHLGAAVRKWAATTKDEISVTSAHGNGRVTLEGVSVSLELIRELQNDWGMVQTAALGYPPNEINYLAGVVNAVAVLRHRVLRLLEEVGLRSDDELEQWHKEWDALPDQVAELFPWIPDEK
jgi:hypothetical protein